MTQRNALSCKYLGSIDSLRVALLQKYKRRLDRHKLGNDKAWRLWNNAHFYGFPMVYYFEAVRNCYFIRICRHNAWKKKKKKKKNMLEK